MLFANLKIQHLFNYTLFLTLFSFLPKTYSLQCDLNCSLDSCLKLNTCYGAIVYQLTGIRCVPLYYSYSAYNPNGYVDYLIMFENEVCTDVPGYNETIPIVCTHVPALYTNYLCTNHASFGTTNTSVCSNC